MKHDGCAGCLYEYGIKEGELCEFCNRNYRDMYKKATRADRIRNMTDEELAKELVKHHIDDGINFCQNLKECDDILNEDKEIPIGKCEECLLNWLRSESEV